MSGTTVILGGGFGGLATATELREHTARDHEIVVIDRSERFYVGFRKLWVLVGRASMEEGTRPLSRLADRGVRFVHTEVLGIDPESRRVETGAGIFDADFLVVALGAEPRTDLVPGLDAASRAFSIYDPASVRAAAPRLRELDRGRAAICIVELPYKCPPAPYEAAFLVDEELRRRNHRDAVRLTFATPQPGLLPNVGPEGMAWLEQAFEDRGIEWRVDWELDRLEAGRLVSPGGEIPYDQAFVVPPHRVPSVVRESGLTGGGEWVPVDPDTLATRHERVWAIGDVTEIPLEGDGALPKAGIFAEGQGRRVARAIATRLAGGPEPDPYDGTGSCFLETGDGKAALIEGEFYRPGGPDVRLAGTTAQNLARKQRFERERLDGWLGA